MLTHSNNSPRSKAHAAPSGSGARRGRALRTLLIGGLLPILLAMVAGCGNVGERTGLEAKGDGPVKVVTTTNFITDTVRQIGGDRVSVSALMGPGVDPHLYKASAGDVNDLREADVIFYGGLYLEAKMQEVLEEIGESRPAFAVTEAIPTQRLLAAPGGAPEGEEYDPHVWFDPALWTVAARTVRDRLIEVDPAGEAGYRRNAREFIATATALDREAERRLSSVPERRRVLVTSHDAFRYLGRKYGVEVAAIQGLSTATEATTADIERIARLIAQRGVRAVFIESSVPSQTVDAVLASARRMGQEAVVGGELFSDAAGQDGFPEGTWAGMFEANLDLLVEGLR